MEKIVASEWDAFTGGFDAWVAQMEQDRINYKLQLIADANFDALVDDQYADMVEEFNAEFEGRLPEGWL
jgi:hypothetical protein